MSDITAEERRRLGDVLGHAAREVDRFVTLSKRSPVDAPDYLAEALIRASNGFEQASKILHDFDVEIIAASSD